MLLFLSCLNKGSYLLTYLLKRKSNRASFPFLTSPGPNYLPLSLRVYGRIPQLKLKFKQLPKILGKGMLFPDFTRCCWLSGVSSSQEKKPKKTNKQKKKKQSFSVAAFQFEKTIVLKCPGGYPGEGYVKPFEFKCAFNSR